MPHDIVRQQFLAHKRSWVNSAKVGLSVDDDFNNIPWYSYNAINFLKNNINNNHIIFEYGCGSSTIFYQSRAKRIISLESNHRWFQIIAQKIINNNKNYHNFILRDNYFKFDNLEIFLLEDAINNPQYENFAKNFSDNYQEQDKDKICENLKFNFIIIDSLKRYQCAINAINVVASGGYIILDDAERDNYKKIIEFLGDNNFIACPFLGIAPAQLKIKNTCFFRKKP